MAGIGGRERQTDTQPATHNNQPTIPMNTRFRLFALALCFLTLATSPALAGDTGASAASVPLFASYWENFLDYWKGAFKKQNGIVMAVLAVGVVALFIITRGKWQK